MTTREKLFLTKQQALDILKKDDQDFKIVQNEYEVYKNRRLHWLVIQRITDGKFFADRYEEVRGDSDIQPWEDHQPDFEEVFPIEKKIIEYK